MQISKYSISEFRQKQNIKALLEKLGVPKELWDNNGASFWDQTRNELRRILEISKKIYKNLAVQLHPRTLTDSDEEAKKLHSLWDAIEKRFEYKLNQRLVRERELPDLSDYVECICGCGKVFKKSIANTGCEKRYYNQQCRRRFRYLKKKKLKKHNEIPIDLFPIVTCACGCGTQFRQKSVGGKVLRKYFSLRCKRKAKYYRDRLSGKKKRDPIKESIKWKKYYAKRWGYKTLPIESYPLVECLCGCGQQFRQIPRGEKTKKFFNKTCKSRYEYQKKFKEQQLRHENLQKILTNIV